MCVETKGYKFNHAFKVQFQDDKSYRILLTNRLKVYDGYTDGYFGVCVDNGVFSTSKETRILPAMRGIICDIIYDSLKIEKLNNRSSPEDKETCYIAAFRGEPRKITDEFFENTESHKSKGNILYELIIKYNLSKILDQKIKKVIYMAVCRKTCKHYKSCDERL